MNQNPEREVCAHQVPVNWNCSKCESEANKMTTIFIKDIGFLTVPSEHKEKIVRAVNSHKALLQAAKAALITFQDDELYASSKEIREKLEKAIAKAEGR